MGRINASRAQRDVCGRAFLAAGDCFHRALRVGTFKGSNDHRATHLTPNNQPISVFSSAGSEGLDTRSVRFGAEASSSMK